MSVLRSRQSFLLMALVSAGMSGEALACACCSEAGQRLELTENLSPYISEELALLRFAPTAKLITDAGFPDSVKGVANPSDKPYQLKASEIKGELTLTLTDAAGGGTGQIVFPLPKKISRFEVDPGKAETSPGRGPDLYKEWRFEGPVRLSGSVATSAKRGTAKLVLHGHGNSCTSAPDITHWTLALTGRGVKFGLMGKFGAPAEEAAARPKKP
jgi:hypothetical protein